MDEGSGIRLEGMNWNLRNKSSPLSSDSVLMSEGAEESNV